MPQEEDGSPKYILFFLNDFIGLMVNFIPQKAACPFLYLTL